jgi:multidrug efflux system membrane fusion protein
LWTLLALAVLVTAIVWLSLHFTSASGAAGSKAAAAGNANRKSGSRRAGRAISVSVAPVKRGDVSEYLNQLGTVTSLATATVHSQIAGQLMRLRFKEGQTVRAGDPLALIDPRPYQAQLSQYEGALDHDRALLENARLDLERYKTLIAQDSTSHQTYDTQAALVKEYEGTVKTDEAQVAATQLDLIYCNVVSPIGGRIGLRQVDVGNYVTPGDTNGLVIVAQIAPISVVFTVPEDDIPLIDKAMKDGGIPVDAFDRAQTQKLASGTVDALDNQVDTTTGTVKLRALFANADGALFPNQFVNVQLLVGTRKNALIVPTSAIERGTSNSSFVYVVQPDSTAAMKTVKLGPSEGERVVVESGIEEGDEVVVDGADQLKDGQAITLASDTKTSAAEPGKSGKGQHHHRDASASGAPGSSPDSMASQPGQAPSRSMGQPPDQSASPSPSGSAGQAPDQAAPASPAAPAATPARP